MQVQVAEFVCFLQLFNRDIFFRIMARRNKSDLINVIRVKWDII